MNFSELVEQNKAILRKIIKRTMLLIFFVEGQYDIRLWRS